MTTSKEPQDRDPKPSPTAEEREEHARRRRRKESYHLVAGHSKLPKEAHDLESDQLYNLLTARPPPATRRGGSASNDLAAGRNIQSAKAALVKELAINGGDVTTPTFLAALHELSQLYDPAAQFDARIKTRRDDLRNHLGGMWMMLSKPNFPGCIGQNDEGEYLYTLGHMSFDMFRPSNLVCSIQGSFNPIHYVGTRQREAIKHVPRTLKEEVKQGNSVLRTYDLVTAFTIEPHNASHHRDSDNGQESPNSSVQRPIKALMTTYGYSLPDPNMPSRLSTWFRGGTIEVWDGEQDMGVWKDIFGNLPPRPFKEKASLFTRKVKTGVAPAERMEADGKLTYSLNKPFGGHGYAYADVVYLDETLRILRGNYGTIYVGARIPFPDE